MFGAAVRKRREEMGLSQEQLATKADLDRTYISGIERGTRNPTLRIVSRIADALECSISDLFGAKQRRGRP